MNVLCWLKDNHLPYSILGLTIVDKKDEEVWIDSTVGEKKLEKIRKYKYNPDEYALTSFCPQIVDISEDSVYIAFPFHLFIMSVEGNSSCLLPSFKMTKTLIRPR